MNSDDLLRFRNKLLEIQQDVELKIVDTELLLRLYDALDKSPYNSIHEMAEMALKISRKRMNEIIEGRRMMISERLNVINYINDVSWWLSIKGVVNQHILKSIKFFGKEIAFKYLGISQRTQQRYLKNMTDKIIN